jgi:putative aldouronate transport system substrate-binding protein
MPAYKDAINYLASLYKEGLIWQECFTANASALNAKLTSQTPVAGCYTSVRPASTPYEDDYVCILPPKAEGYETCWYYHYAVHGSKNQFFVMNTCENLSVLMAWMDKFYEFENALAFDYGFADEGRYEVGADGKVTIYDLDDDAIEKAEKENPTLSHILGNYVRSITASDYQNYVNPYEDKITADNCYNLYKDVLNTELWPRPYFSVDDAYNADLYMTDIDYQTTLYRASWITGKSDVNQEFDSFVKKLESLHLNEYIDILQKSYDAAMANVK